MLVLDQLKDAIVTTQEADPFQSAVETAMELGVHRNQVRRLQERASVICVGLSRTGELFCLQVNLLSTSITVRRSWLSIDDKIKDTTPG